MERAAPLPCDPWLAEPLRRAGVALPKRAPRWRARRRAAESRLARNRGHNPFGLIGRGLAGLWMGLAHAIGWLVRAIGRQAATAKELDREHRRDGGGLLLIGIAIVLAVAVWFHGAGPFGAWLATGTHLAVGADGDGAAAAAARRRRPADA